MQRSQPPLQLSKPPLALVLAQVRMSPVEAMEKYVPEIQDRFRKAGFPEFRTRQLPSNLAWNGSELVGHAVTQWEFADKPNTTSILLNPDAITLQTTAYKRFEDLCGTIRLAFAIVHEIVELGQVHRYGLRYVNVVRMGGDENLANWIKLPLLGHPSFEGAHRVASFAETLLETERGSRLVGRCVTLPQGLPIPADLFPCTLDYPHPNPLKEPFAILDNDHSRENPGADFDPEAATLGIGDLHELLDEAFLFAVTTHALEQWT